MFFRQPHLVKLGDISQLQNLSIDYDMSFETLPFSLRTVDYSLHRSNEEIFKDTCSLSKLTNIESLKIPLDFIKDISFLSKLSSLTLSNYIDPIPKERIESQLMDLSGVNHFDNSSGHWNATKEIDLDYLIHLEVLKLQNTMKIVSLPTTLADFQLCVSKP
ncbi:hypothetical protein QTN25_007459 [Entamoeba marina]